MSIRVKFKRLEKLECLLGCKDLFLIFYFRGQRPDSHILEDFLTHFTFNIKCFIIIRKKKSGF